MKPSKLRKFLPVVKAIALVSKDRKAKIGAIAFGPGGEQRMTGYNGFPRRCDDEVDARHVKPLKLHWMAHAEENVVSQAARAGVSLYGCTLLVTGLFPCTTCARLIVQSGIRRVVMESPPDMSNHNPQWTVMAEISKQMFREAGVEVLYLSDLEEREDGCKESSKAGGEESPRQEGDEEGGQEGCQEGSSEDAVGVSEQGDR